MSAPSASPSCNSPKAKLQAVLGILVPFIAVVLIAVLVITTNQ